MRADFVDPAWVRACRAELGAALTVHEIDAGHVLYLERTEQVADADPRLPRRAPMEGADG